MPTARPLNAVQARPDLDRSIGLDRVDLIGSGKVALGLHTLHT